MGLLFGGERRSWVPERPIPPNSEGGRGFGARRVDLSSTESSLQKIAVYASVRLLREVVASMPLDFYSEAGAGPARQIDPPKWMQDPAGDGYGLTDWLSQVTYCDAMRGNVVARIASIDNFGQPRQLVLLHPDAVSVHRTDGRPEWTVNGASVPAEKIWHRRSFSIPGSVWGLSPIGAHALTVGLGLASEQFGAQFFIDGGHPTALFQNTKSTVDPDKAATIKARIRAVLAGNREPLVLGADWDYKPLQTTPNDSQFLATNNYTSSECARIFGPGMPAVLGYETGGSLTYANVEQFNQQLLTFTLDPWLVRLERMVYDLLPRPQYARFNRGALLRTDLLTRYRAHEIALRNEFETVNEVRGLEDRPPVEWGDQPTAAKTTPPIPVQMEA
ncbi:MAG: phage portal protein [Nonomuraea sp.]|nr:phage portal protein [Nonomuraea sp.]